MKIPPANGRFALTLMEGVVLMAVMALLLAVFLPVFRNARHRANDIHCVNNLMQVGIASRIWQGDHQGRLPMDVSVAQGGAQELLASGNVAACFQVMSNELSTPYILACLNDSQRHAATNWTEGFTLTNISYFIGLDVTETNPFTLFSGDANLAQNGRPVPVGILNLGSHTTTWTPDRHQGYGNILVADGSVQIVSQMGVAASGSGFATNRVVIP